MKTRKNLSVIAIFVVTLFITLSACQKDDSSNPGCGSYISASTSGFLNQDNCFSDLVKFKLVQGNSLEFTAKQPGDTAYSCVIKIGTEENPFTTIGTYQCGEDQPGCVELIVHGTKDEIYKPVSGKINVTVYGSDVFIASFNVKLEGQSNREMITFKGNVRY